MLIRYIDNLPKNPRLILNVFESLHRFFYYEKNSGIQPGEASMKTFFEANGGFDALNYLSNSSNFEIYSGCKQIMEDYFNDNNDEIDFFFS